jgi:hypothetical protein
VQLGQVLAGNAHVDGLAFHVQAVLGHAARVLVQLRVRFRRAVARNHVQGRMAAVLGADAVEQHQQLRIHGRDLVVAVVAQQLVDVLQRFRNELAFRPENTAQAFAGVGVVEAQDALVRRRGAGNGGSLGRFDDAGAPITDASMAELLRKERRWFMSFP